MTGKQVTVIPMKPKKWVADNTEEKPKLKVAAYCRVSTEMEEQASSYEAQVQHYTDYIQKNPDWELAGIFADEGISGTDTKKRAEFNRMIDACKNGEIEYIITKSISRFARNTVDCLQYIRKLKELKIAVFFEKENINTMDAKGEVLLTIMASLAQQESQSLSQNTKMGVQYRFQQGQLRINHNHFLGYTKDEDGNLVVEPKEAEIIKRIFREYLEGSSLQDIAKGLMDDGILTGGKRKLWRAEGVRLILRNEKYMGDALLQKTFTVDFLTKKRVKNDGSYAQQYYVENSHPAIIPKDIFTQAQQELDRRKSMKNKNSQCFSGKYALTGITICGDCGNVYRRVHWKNRGTVWRCKSRVDKREHNCNGRTIYEKDLHQGILQAINETLIDRDVFLQQLTDNINSVLTDGLTEQLAGLDEQLKDLESEIISVAIGGQGYDELASQIFSLRDERDAVAKQIAANTNLQQRVDEMVVFVKEHDVINEYSEVLVRRLIEKVTIFEKNIVVDFKSGVRVTVEI
ncbi:recombinase family protein [Listeria monocytogenes]|uniref:Recombinase family protein n=1 Tax=Listeria monocytogenes TaxID=1639 RepID=A0AAD2RAF5_LISMN|nr:MULTISPECIES: recombinase family protein [Lactobacillales]EAA0054567.1 recombinase family protein [Listeria monocytogenes]DAM03891.1 MAG TPA: integrase [Caudoviricetes sp.]EAA0073326.1 recombinase family protein [Listeria monocytogenes]EAA0387427.1 recombinase family protein [Listeria monocytogenes]EAA0387917.1 recombinase family protein [Listeria monocytogenes]